MAVKVLPTLSFLNLAPQIRIQLGQGLNLFCGKPIN